MPGLCPVDHEHRRRNDGAPRARRTRWACSMATISKSASGASWSGPAANLKRARLLLASGLAALALCAVVASSLALTRPGAGRRRRPAMKQAEPPPTIAAITRKRPSNSKTPCKLEPANLKAKLLSGPRAAAAVHPGRDGAANPAGIAGPRSSISTCWRVDPANKAAPSKAMMTAGHQHQAVRRGPRLGAEGDPGRPDGQEARIIRRLSWIGR